MVEIKKKLLNRFLRSIGDEVLEVPEESRISGKEGQIRLFLIDPPEYVLVLKRDLDLNIIVPLTPYFELLPEEAPILVLEGPAPDHPFFRGDKARLVLKPLPFWVHVHEKILTRYSTLINMHIVNEEVVGEIKEYIKLDIKSIKDKYVRKFVEKNLERWQDINWSSILYNVIKGEEEEEISEIVVQAPEVFKEGSYALAADISALRGDNWLGVKEENKLVIYPARKSAKIKVVYKDTIIYEGPFISKIVVEGIKDVPKDIEEGLHVEFF
ncbi:hypothetical protein Thal_0003 [Thermocrinis albus DSM 14484]|uniref:Uncharacterized protein n=1 Tax=Thermocrinis albus (strain DSM 14484 / JCM 11386 / HI 11/12) TaxID=638303 RepID=D3SNA4_THEAH|nr:hypothetical protein [Thermocrinis albus]ADC88641.1 hypothetical protein Thal_0003 [Thermocrinis albus DSM 14484]